MSPSEDDVGAVGGQFGKRQGEQPAQSFALVARQRPLDVRFEGEVAVEVGREPRVVVLSGGDDAHLEAGTTHRVDDRGQLDDFRPGTGRHEHSHPSKTST